MTEKTQTLLKLDEEEVKKLYMRVFNTDDGQLVLEDLRNRCYIKSPTAPEGGIVDEARVLMNEGKRSVVLHIETQIEPKVTEPTETEVKNV